MPDKPRYQELMQTMFRSEPAIQWEGRRGLLKMQGGLVADIALSIMGVVNSFPCVKVRIVGSEGAIAQHTFSFMDYWSNESRIDDRVPGRPGVKHPWPHDGGRIPFSIDSLNGEPDWYIARPSHAAQDWFAQTVVRWCRTWEHVTGGGHGA